MVIILSMNNNIIIVNTYYQSAVIVHYTLTSAVLFEIYYFNLSKLNAIVISRTPLMYLDYARCFNKKQLL